MLKKLNLLLIVTLFYGYGFFAQEAPRPMPGAILSIYSLTDTEKPLPGVEPVSVVVDGSNQFSYGNMRKNTETAKYTRQDVFMVWKGYVSVPAKGSYTISMSYNNPSSSHYYCTILQIIGKDFLKIKRDNRDSKCNDALSLLLEQGDYEFTIIHNGGWNADFSVQMWNKATPLKKMSITPASMVHAE